MHATKVTQRGKAAEYKRDKRNSHQKEVLDRIIEGRHDPLPVSVAAKPPHLVFISQCTPLIAAAAKKVALSAIRNQPINLDETIQAILLQIWNNGYNSGLKDMDQMHQQ